ncbi:hypothetical protein VNO78_33188 [Psophocarpus tetragonolobus]|uniref:Uncharacterized protein n=1 Tax=Psophocarpus tetragonolobus TaxID=3891 RepID=A0AAN9RS76_PSOTE
MRGREGGWKAMERVREANVEDRVDTGGRRQPKLIGHLVDTTHDARSSHKKEATRRDTCNHRKTMEKSKEFEGIKGW